MTLGDKSRGTARLDDSANMSGTSLLTFCLPILNFSNTTPMCVIEVVLDEVLSPAVIAHSPSIANEEEGVQPLVIVPPVSIGTPDMEASLAIAATPEIDTASPATAATPAKEHSLRIVGKQEPNRSSRFETRGDISTYFLFKGMGKNEAQSVLGTPPTWYPGSSNSLAKAC